MLREVINRRSESVFRVLEGAQPQIAVVAEEASAALSARLLPWTTGVIVVNDVATTDVGPADRAGVMLFLHDPRDVFREQPIGDEPIGNVDTRATSDLETVRCLAMRRETVFGQP
jgi:hypothetical protein